MKSNPEQTGSGSAVEHFKIYKNVIITSGYPTHSPSKPLAQTKKVRSIRFRLTPLTASIIKMRTASLLFSLAAIAGMAAAKRGCLADQANPGQGWYQIVEGDDLDSIAADFGTTAADLAKTNNIQNPNFIVKNTTIVVPCPAP
ncbi:hypothetical protein LY76DRAFT_224734 [Colletotrichum caudatum]|nr:hypothetical protein LY76DRAFT_224734 [Colletotrichum caudatum]